MFNSENQFKKIIDNARIDAKPDPGYRNKLREKMLLTFEAQKQNPAHPLILADNQANSSSKIFTERFLTMKNLTKIAATIIFVVVIVAFFTLFTHSTTPTFAEIIKPLLSARTVTFKVTVSIEGMPEQTREGMYMEPGLLRQDTGVGGVQIYDFTQGRALVLVNEQKMAMEMENLPESQGGFFEIRELIRQVQENPEATVEFLGEKQIDGQKAIGYLILQQRIEIKVWADVENNRPIRVETSMGDLLGKEAHSVMHDFAFDVELDPSLFSLEIPDDYRVIANPLDASKGGEQNLIELLGLTKDIPDSQFPDALTMAGMENFIKSLKSKFEGQDFNEQEKIQQAVTMMIPLMGGLTFVQMLPPESDWHYTGKGVKVGATDTPIFWYKPEGSDTYRVIYADLTVKNLSVEQLPDVPDAQTRDSQTSILEIPNSIKK